MIKSTILAAAAAAALLASTQALALTDSEFEKVNKLCKIHASLAETVATVRHKTNDIGSNQVEMLMQKAPATRPIFLVAFQTDHVPSGFFSSDDQEIAIKRFKNLWYAKCIKDWTRKFKDAE
tara:strand:- start:11343 stop:11708 length:366 start_codon:yes stop_codon:yes gene_type:complete